MRVGIGTILSVLSFSVLAAVIPNYDDHGLLLARRTVNSDPMDLLWKRADEDQEGSEPSGSGADTSAGTSDNSQSSKKGGLFKSFMQSRNARKQKSAQKSDKRYVNAAIKKLTKVVEHSYKNAFILKTGSFLSYSLEEARRASNSYTNEATIPFFLLIPEGTSKKLLTNEMVKIQNTGKNAAKKNLMAVIRLIRSITKHPEGVEVALEKIATSVLHMYKAHKSLYEKEYDDLVSKVEPANNEEYTKRTEDFISSMKNYQEHSAASFYSAGREIGNDELAFKEKKLSRFGKFKSGVKSRLGLKSKSPTGVTSTQDESDQGQLKQDVTGQTIAPGGKKTFV
ncbi:hypothetical protein BASA61_000091 [Batrachochytrium salamandrivorans]|nr:hypothetical protein BASA61_000091 [Batrachochytrium salamandrivorans]KAH9246765.1 hypothetical protein BASA81_015687 [Batrachochytrium salamandrivorans]KAH9275332.1 hypothetical protein BASA83_002104 [Batrachochytrium salamandrivorans]